MVKRLMRTTQTFGDPERGLFEHYGGTTFARVLTWGTECHFAQL